MHSETNGKVETYGQNTISRIDEGRSTGLKLQAIDDELNSQGVSSGCNLGIGILGVVEAGDILDIERWREERLLKSMLSNQ